ncbi:division/cell wall cluster transcriptional repressor MraZ [Aestuariispira insulae]|uniref:Transcriptional regulator MraZ n=1 Tax=Aestuariispira insulae TaxID=1461337 RepID=A0A3D9HXG5_9PROT|nr:division/cell wall cluster transcriptional repressor MraZ [Aestuariispira insulae]RED54105.1 division/cell wall cluster transcriptional repressor MraZ [Aestuariispira insulae]
MALFTGTFENKVDQKGRVSLPADYRDLLSDNGNRSFYIFPSPNADCLEACDETFMQRVADSIEEQAAMFSEEEQGLSYIISNARRVSYDSTGRFVLPAEFADYAGISNLAVFVGMAARFQIWQPDAHKASLPDRRNQARGLTLKLKRPGADQ